MFGIPDKRAVFDLLYRIGLVNLRRDFTAILAKIRNRYVSKKKGWK
jgi:hypothetical protein